MDIFDLINKNLRSIELDLANAEDALKSAEEEIQKLKANLNPDIEVL